MEDETLIGLEWDCRRLGVRFLHGSAEKPEEELGPTGASPEAGDSSSSIDDSEATSSDAEASPSTAGDNEVDDINAWVSRICRPFELPADEAAGEAPEEDDDGAVESEPPVQPEEVSDPVEVAEAVEVNDAPEVAETIEAGHAVEVAEAVEVSDAPEVAEAVEVSDAPEVAEAIEAGHAVEVAEAVEVSDAPEVAEAVEAAAPAAMVEVEQHAETEEERPEQIQVLELEDPEKSEEGLELPGLEPEQSEDSAEQFRQIEIEIPTNTELEQAEGSPIETPELELGLVFPLSLDSHQELEQEQDTLLLGIPAEPEPFFAPVTEPSEPEFISEPEIISKPEAEVPPESSDQAEALPPTEDPTPLPKESVAPKAPEPAAPEPAVSEPVVSEPVVSEPVVSEPAVSEPVKQAARKQDKLQSVYQTQEIAEPQHLALDTELLKAEKKPSKRPGGTLRSLEEALANTVTRKLPEGIENRALAAVKFLSTLECTERAMALIVNDSGKMQVVVAGGMGEDSLKQTSMRILRTVLSTNTSLLLLDCTKDARFGKDSVILEQKIRSVVCVPFQDCVSKAKGLLYADNISKPGAFSYRDLGRVEDFARTLATQQSLGPYEQSVSVNKPAEAIEVERPPAIAPWIFVAAIFSILFMILPTLTWSDDEEASPSAVETPLVVEHKTADAETVVVAYLRALESGNFANAYLFLSPKIRARVSKEDFQQRAQAYLKEGNNALEMSKSTVIADSVEKESVKTYLIRPLRKDETKWTWTLRKDRDLWYLDSLQGGLEF